MTFDNTGKKQVRIMGRVLIHTSADIIYYSHGKDKQWMTKVLDAVTASEDNCLIIEGDGHILYDESASFESERVGDYEEFQVQLIGGKA